MTNKRSQWNAPRAPIAWIIIVLGLLSWAVSFTAQWLIVFQKMKAAIMWVVGVSVFFFVMLFCYIMYRRFMTRHADNRARIFMAISILCYLGTAAVDIATIYILFGEGEEIIDSIKWIVIGSLSHIFKLWALFIALITSGRYVREKDEVKPILGQADQP